MDLSSFDLNDQYSDGPIQATAEDQAELASIFDEEAAPMVAPQFDAQQAIVASIQALTGNRSKTAKVGVKSIGKAYWM